MRFADQARVHVRSGKGGSGCLSFRREKFIEFGGPDGGDGGRGGDVVALCVAGLNTLIDFRYRRHVKAANGRGGAGRDRSGAGGADAVLELPVGTQIFDAEDGTMIADLVRPGQRAIIAKGGRGGRGNAHFKSSTNRAPRRADPGEPAEERLIELRLKLLADVGLVGLPNAGKSTFLAAVSRARPKIASYPFTTLAPQLGVVEIDDGTLVLADIPGLIEGAHAGGGLGHRFLGHVERCAVLIHLVDGTAEDVAADYAIVRDELARHGHGLVDKPSIPVLNKIDALDPATVEERRRQLSAAAGAEALAASGVSGAGVRAVLRAAAGPVRAARESETVA